MVWEWHSPILFAGARAAHTRSRQAESPQAGKKFCLGSNSSVRGRLCRGFQLAVPNLNFVAQERAAWRHLDVTAFGKGAQVENDFLRQLSVESSSREPGTAKLS